VSLEGGSTIDQVFRTGRPAHVDDYEQVGGQIGTRLRASVTRCGAAGPIVVGGRLWGVMSVASQRSLPPGTEHRVAQFAELVSTAISNLESRAKADRLVAEQSALRRVAELVAAQPPPEQVFALVTEELLGLLKVTAVRTVRFEPDGSATVLAARSGVETLEPPGTNYPPPSGGVLDQVLRTGRAARGRRLCASRRPDRRPRAPGRGALRGCRTDSR
jgi:GAF domain-containing protein